MSTLNSIREKKISKQFLLKVLLLENSLVVKTKGFGGFYFQSISDQNTKHGSGSICLEEQEEVSAKSLTKDKKDKWETENDQERVFVGEFTYETLPSECRVWFNDINDVYETLIDEDATEIFRTLEGLEIRLRIVIEKNQKSFVRINKFVLHVNPSEEVWEEELVKIEAIESENSEISPSDKQQKSLIEIKSSSSNSNENEETLKNKNKTVVGSEEEFKDQGKNTFNEIERGTEKEIKELKRQLSQCFSFVEETKNNTDSLREFVESFMSRMQVKWESMTKELGDVREKNKYLERKYEKFKEMAKVGFPREIKYDEKMKEIKVDYKFSEKNKHEDIKVINKNTIKCFSQDSTFKIIMVEPTTFLTKRNPLNNYFQLNLKVNRIENYIAVGVCEKEIVKALKFKEFETDIKGHGCYLLDWNGECWSNYRPENKSKPNKALKFKENDVISLVFQSNRKMLRVSKLGKEEGGKNFVNMLIDPIVPLNELCFCVFLSGNGDEIEIMDRESPVVIDLELQELENEERF